MAYDHALPAPTSEISSIRVENRYRSRGFRAEEACRRVALRQFGVISLAQALGAGMSRQAVYRRARSGRWEIALPDVFRLEGAPRTFRQFAMAASLWAGSGAALARRTAGAIHGLAGLTQGGIVEVISPRYQRTRAGIRVLQRSALEEVDMSRVGPLHTTSPARTWIDLAGVYPDYRLEQWLHQIIRERLDTLDGVLFRFGALAARGRNGIARARRVLASQDHLLEVPRSVLETDFARLAKRFGLPPYVAQFEVPIENRRAFLDFAYPDVKLGIEIDSWLHHSDRLAFESDRARADELVALGWRILHFTARQIRERPYWVAQKVLQALIA